jgi:hypothetical protein
LIEIKEERKLSDHRFDTFFAAAAARFINRNDLCVCV